MLYRPRHAEARLRKLAAHFKVVLVTGARQVGKTTLLRHVFPDARIVTFDPVQDVHGARRDPDFFLDNFPPPLILDEIQFAPELLGAIKRRVDESEAPGQYLMTGSQNLAAMRSASESLAGRVGVLSLDAMTVEEMTGCADRDSWLGAYLREPFSLPAGFGGVLSDCGTLTRFLWRGAMPGLLDLDDSLVLDFHRSYVQTCVERDVRAVHDVRDVAAFGRMLTLLGALTAQELDVRKLSRDLGVAAATITRWLALLGATFQWIELPAYHGNAVKRVTSRRKGHLRDTGTASFLQRLSTPEAVAVSPSLGSLFESSVVNAVQARFVTLPLSPLAWHWRTSAGAEVDLVLELDGRLHPIEIKCKSAVSPSDLTGLRAFRATYPEDRVAPGLVIYAGRECLCLDRKTVAWPWNGTLK